VPSLAKKKTDGNNSWQKAIGVNSLLFAMRRVFGGIHADGQPLFVLPFQEGVGGSGESAVQGFSPLQGITQDVLSQPGEHGLTGPSLLISTNLPPPFFENNGLPCYFLLF
jgi:hypothetical protein